MDRQKAFDFIVTILATNPNVEKERIVGESRLDDFFKDQILRSAVVKLIERRTGKIKTDSVYHDPEIRKIRTIGDMVYYLIKNFY